MLAVHTAEPLRQLLLRCCNAAGVLTTDTLKANGFLGFFFLI